MDAKVIRKFIDKQTKLKYRPGDKYEATKSRIDELIKLGYVVEAKKEAE